MSDFDIFLDSDNELTFEVEIQGAGESDVRSQFVVEGPRGMNLAFEGRAQGCEITVDVPSLKGVLREGQYSTRLEVIVDDRIFVPLNMQANIKPTVKVEAVVKTSRKTSVPVVTASVKSRGSGAVISETTPTRPKVKHTQEKSPPKQPRAPRDNRGSTRLDTILDKLEKL